MKILIIEDRKDLLYALTTILTVEGYEVETAETFLTGKLLISKNKYDLVIADLLLPAWAELELAEAINNNIHQLNIPVIVITETEDSMFDNTFGFAEICLTKPLNKKLLMLAIKSVLRN